MTTSWQRPRPLTLRGIHEATSLSRGNIASFSHHPAFGAARSLKREPISPPISSREPRPKASAIRRSDPRALMSSGKELPVCSNKRAFPPPGSFDMRSVISVISSTGSANPEILTSSPSLSSRSTNALNPLYAMFRIGYPSAK